MTAISYIKKKINRKYGNRLLKAVGSHLRNKKKISKEKYYIEDLIEDMNNGTLARKKGVGKVTLQQLESQLEADGYL